MPVAADGHKRGFASRRIADGQVSFLGFSRDGKRAIDFLAFLLQLKVRLKKKKSECTSTQICMAATFCKRCATQKRKLNLVFRYSHCQNDRSNTVLIYLIAELDECV